MSTTLTLGVCQKEPSPIRKIEEELKQASQTILSNYLKDNSKVADDYDSRYRLQIASIKCSQELSHCAKNAFDNLKKLGRSPTEVQDKFNKIKSNVENHLEIVLGESSRLYFEAACSTILSPKGERPKVPLNNLESRPSYAAWRK
ncbi:MAG: hypothetical protein H0U71_00730 [Gammaproteobacteria bacterium]|nr:hypothetical protein [Gammaproteobacteria bacterium]